MSVSKRIRTAVEILLYLSLLQLLNGFEIENNNRLKITSKHGYELTQTVNVQRQENLQKMCQTLDGGASSMTNAEFAGGGYLKPPPSPMSSTKGTKDGRRRESDVHDDERENDIGEDQEEDRPPRLYNVDELSEVQKEHLLVDKEHRLLYCYVPKVACTNWKRILMMLTGQWNGTDPLLIPATLAHSPNMFMKLADLSPDEQQSVLMDYTKFLVVRHPFERLLSAYRNKLESDQGSALYFHQRIGRQIIRSFRPNASNESLALGNDVTFSEFIQYLLTPEMSMNYQSNQSYNEHWEPIASLCNPCLVKYNIIGKYETLIDDSGLVLKTLGVDWVTFPAGQRTSGTGEKLRRYFDDLPISMIRSLYKLYERDFKLFGYNLDEVLGFELG